MSKQTSLQFFLMGLIDLEIGKGIPTDKEIQLHNLYAQARAIHREEVNDAVMHGVNEIKVRLKYDKDDFYDHLKKYYTETYGGEK